MRIEWFTTVWKTAFKNYKPAALYSFSVSVYAGSLGETAFVTHAPRKLLNNLLMTPFAEKKNVSY